MELEVSFSISINVFEKLRKKGAEYKRRVGNKYLYHNEDGFDLVDKNELPDDLGNSSGKSSKSRKRSKSGRSGASGWTWKNDREENRKKRRGEKLSRSNGEGRTYRQHVYDGSSDSKVAKRAADNHYVMQDVLADPSLVGSSSETEAVAKVASENPGWAKMSDLVDAYDIDVDADGNVADTGTDTGSSSTGDSTGLAEAASDAASYNGSVSTADAGDLGPTGPSGYSSGDAGSGSGSGGSSGGDSLGGGTGGGDAGGGDL